jgi:PIN domain nuclease of toxin-antitoxin system
VIWLLDTHSLLWFVVASPKLSLKARAVIEDPTNQLFFSAASLWEVAIKVSLGKLDLGEPFDHFFPRQLDVNRIVLLRITVAHASALVNLPHHHRDPFDRILVAQAQVESLSIVSGDPALDAYGVSRLW